MQEIGDWAFWGCSGLTTINFPSTLQKIGSSAFSSCSGLTIIDFPSSLQKIEDSAFSSCSGLTTINLPSTLQEIEVSAFEECSDLGTVYCATQIPPKLGFRAFFQINTEAILYVPTGCKSAYEQAEGWNTSFKEIREFDPSTNIESTTYPEKEDIVFANGQLSLSASYTGLAEVKVYTTTGSLAGMYFVAPGSSCDLSALSPGIYAVEVKVDGKVIRTKIAK